MTFPTHRKNFFDEIFTVSDSNNIAEQKRICKATPLKQL